MARDEAYQEAERRIEAARQEGVKELDLRNLGLTEIPESIARLIDLKKLDLGGDPWQDSPNQFTEVPGVIAALTQLKSLDLSGSQLTELPEAMAALTQLKSLDLSGNQLTELPEAMAALTQLKSLDLSRNHLTKVPGVIAALTQLETLYLGDNSLTELAEIIGCLSNLKKLFLYSNRLKKLPSSLSDLKSLEILCLASIGNKPDPKNGNPLNQLPECIRGIRSLDSLQVNDCQLNEMPAWLNELTEVRNLILDFNNLIDLPTSLGNIPTLQSISLGGNPLNSDLAAAHEQGTEAVKQYLRARAEGEIVLNTAKLILVGEGEVGKSCLLGALRGDKWIDGRPTTHGIEIKPVIVNSLEHNAEITLNGWDFGGQRVYRPTHQLFFSSTAVYLVVWKPREGPQQGFVKEWITLIKHREPDAKILVVATHGGPGQRQPDIDRQELIDLFGSDTVLGFHHIDSKEGTGIAELREAIAKVAATLPGMGRKVPTKWQQIRELLEASGNPYMPYSDVIALCEEHRLEGFAAELFVRVSHKLGYLIHYHYDEILKDTVILQPDWLAKAVSFVLDDELTRDRNGLVEFDRLSQIWSHPPFEGETGYPTELHPIFLRLMERFDLSYRVVLDPAAPEASNTHLIAQLVPDQRPEQLPNWGAQPESGDRQQVQICRIVDDRGQSANAEGLFYQLIVRLHKYSLGRNNYPDSVHWQRGLMLDNDYNGRALLEHIGNDVKITVRAAYPERFLSYLTEEVKWLVESFWEGLNCNIMVPCIAPCGMENPGQGLFEVQKLIESKKKNRPEFPCTVSGCDEWQNIDQLLNNAPTTPAPSQVIGIDQFQSMAKDLENAIRSDLVKLDRREHQRYQALSQEQRAMMSRIDQQFAYLMQMLIDEAKEGPRLFSFKPVDPGFFDRPNWVAEKFQLTLWCEHSRKPLPVLNPDAPKQGVYELELNREWFTKAVPVFKFVTGTLSLVLPVAASTTQFMLDDSTYQGIKEELDLGQKSLEFGIKSSNIAVDWHTKRDAAEFEQGEAIRAQGAMLRELHAMLKEKDPGFGGLVRVQNKRREFLWVHPQFVDEY